jgi:hypothetical protein
MKPLAFFIGSFLVLLALLLTFLKNNCGTDCLP